MIRNIRQINIDELEADMEAWQVIRNIRQINLGEPENRTRSRHGSLMTGQKYKTIKFSELESRTRKVKLDNRKGRFRLEN